MAYEIIIDTPAVTVRYEPNDKYIHHTFHTTLTGAPFREVMDTALDHLIKNHGTKWLSDDRQYGEFIQADMEYSVASWSPRAAASGWKFWAIVVPESIAGRASMQDLVEMHYNMGVRVMVFTDLEKARAWLVAQ